MCGTGLCFFLALLQYAAAAKQPNIIFILADDYGFHDIGYHGSEIKTPNLDKLAKNGVKLENYYVQPICSPSRLQFLTGRYQIHLGLQHSIIWAAQPYGMPLDTPTIAEKLKDLGYSTHAVGKWHVGFYKKEYLPTSRGFDSFYGLLTGSSDYYFHRRCDGGLCGFDLRNNTTPLNPGKGLPYSTHRFAARTNEIIRKHKDDASKVGTDGKIPEYPQDACYGGNSAKASFPPKQSPSDIPGFFHPYLTPVYDTHNLINLNGDYFGGNQVYRIPDKTGNLKDGKFSPVLIAASMVSCMDEAVGNITQTLVDTGLMDTTIIVFSTDNGGDVEEGGNNWPLRGAKGTLWEGGIRGVGFVHSPLLSDDTKGSHFTGLMHISDWFPTFLRRAGGDVDELSLDGHDQWDFINSDTPIRGSRNELLHNIDPLHGRRGKLSYSDTFDSRRRAALRVGHWKLITGDPGKGRWIPPPTLDLPIEYGEQPLQPKKNIWLFDIGQDPAERYDVSHLFPDVVKEMLDKLKNYEQTALPCRYPDKDPRADPELHGHFWGPWL